MKTLISKIIVAVALVAFGGAASAADFTETPTPVETEVANIFVPYNEAVTVRCKKKVEGLKVIWQQVGNGRCPIDVSVADIAAAAERLETSGDYCYAEGRKKGKVIAVQVFRKAMGLFNKRDVLYVTGWGKFEGEAAKHYLAVSNCQDGAIRG